MSTCFEMRVRICLSVWSIALIVTLPSMPGWMSTFTFVSRAMASSTSRTGWLATTIEYLISAARASGGGGIGAGTHGLRDGRGGGGAGGILPQVAVGLRDRLRSAPRDEHGHRGHGGAGRAAVRAHRQECFRK